LSAGLAPGKVGLGPGTFAIIWVSRIEKLGEITRRLFARYIAQDFSDHAPKVSFGNMARFRGLALVLAAKRWLSDRFNVRN
jgi:hypothetical protein